MENKILEKINEIISLTESFDNSLKVKPLGSKKDLYVEVFKNPSFSEYREVLKSYDGETPYAQEYRGNFVRGFFDGKNIFIWRGDVGHNDLWREYPLMRKSKSVSLVLSKEEGIFLTSPIRVGFRGKKEAALELRKKILKFATDLKRVPLYLDESGEKELKYESN